MNFTSCKSFYNLQTLLTDLELILTLIFLRTMSNERTEISYATVISSSHQKGSYTITTVVNLYDKRSILIFARLVHFLRRNSTFLRLPEFSQLLGFVCRRRQWSKGSTEPLTMKNHDDWIYLCQIHLINVLIMRHPETNQTLESKLEIPYSRLSLKMQTGCAII